MGMSATATVTEWAVAGGSGFFSNWGERSRLSGTAGAGALLCPRGLGGMWGAGAGVKVAAGPGPLCAAPSLPG